MDALTPHEVASYLLALGLLLAAARLGGEVLSRLGQPAVVGEVIAGVLLGRTVLGRIAPGLSDHLFPRAGKLAAILDGFGLVAVVVFLFTAGLEIDLGVLRKRARLVTTLSLGGLLGPAAAGVGAGLVAPDLFGREPGQATSTFAALLGTMFCISALPVVARTLHDLELLRTPLGAVIVASAAIDDLAGWFAFVVVLGIARERGLRDAGWTVAPTLLFVALMLTVVRALVRRHLAWVGRTFGRRGGILGLTFSIAMLAAACAEYLGTHAAFGAFLAGVALGGAPDFDARTREPIERIASFVLAPLFFATLGLRIDFLASFDPPLVAAVVVVACAGKLLGASCAARLAGLPAREAWAAGAALNARGGMEIILGLLALRSGLVGERLFVALVATALLTSIAAGPSIRLALRGAPRSPGRAAPEAPEPQGP